MDFVLDPPNGVDPVFIGMPLDVAIEAASAWGQARLLNRPNRTPKAAVSLPGGFGAVLHFEDGENVTAVEVWRSRSDTADVRVLFKGVDVFRTPARKVLRALEDDGHEVRDAKSEYPRVSGLAFGFTRAAGHSVALDKDRLPLYFEAVLVADGSYYD